MSRRYSVVGGLLFMAFVLFVVYSSTRLSEFSCEVCIEFKGRTNCGAAAGQTEEEARAAATTVACAPISSGVSESIACSNVTPKSSDCTKN